MCEQTKPEEGGSEVSGDSWASLCCPCLIWAPGIGWQREAHRSQRSSPATCPTRPWLTLTRYGGWRDAFCYAWSTLWLTGVDLLQRDVLLQQSAKFDLGPVLPAGAIVGQDEVGVAIVEHSQLAQWVGHRLIGSGYLEKRGRKLAQNVSRRNISMRDVASKETKCSKCSHIFSKKVLFVFQDPPWRNSYCTHFPSWLGGMLL